MSELDRLIGDIITTIRSYRFPPIGREALLQEHITSVLTRAGMVCDREVTCATREGLTDGRGRYDISVRRDGVHVVLELKLNASIAAVERQAQAYIMSPDVDAVIIVTTSNRLAASMPSSGTLPGEARDQKVGDGMARKPFCLVHARSGI